MEGIGGLYSLIAIIATLILNSCSGVLNTVF